MAKLRIPKRQKPEKRNSLGSSNEGPPGNLAMIGTRASGKSTCIGLLYLTALDMTIERGESTPGNGTNLIRGVPSEGSSTVREVIDRIREGRFPPPTTSGVRLQSNLHLTYRHKKSKFSKPRDHNVELAISDVAGETLSEMMRSFEAGNFDAARSAEYNDVNRFLLSADRFIMVLDLENIVESALDRERSADTSQDVSLSRFVDCLKRYKDHTPGREIKSVALICTKYDRVDTALASLPYGDVVNRKREFMTNFMPMTWVALESLFSTETEDKLKVIYSSIDLKETEEDEEPEMLREQGKLRPVYSRDQYVELINWIGEVTR